MFQVWRWRELLFNESKIYSSPTVCRAGCSLPALPLLLVPITRGSYGKFQDYSSQYSLFSEPGKHSRKRDPKQAFVRQNLSTESSWKLILLNFSHMDPTFHNPRWKFPSELNTWSTCKWNSEKWALNPEEKGGIKHFHFFGGGESLERGRVWSGRQGKELLSELGSGLLRSRNELGQCVKASKFRPQSLTSTCYF